MRKILLLVCTFLAVSVAAQRNRKPAMEPVYAKGYYVTQRNDTLFGEVKTNPENEIEFYSHFFFKTEGATRGRVINTQRAKAYGFDGRDFVQTTLEGRKVFYERLAAGRLRFYELKKKGKEDGYDAIISEFYIRDTQPESVTPELQIPRKVSKKFYKRTLKPYMSDQPMIWADLDKFNFDLNRILQAVAEYNRYYANTAN